MKVSVGTTAIKIAEWKPEAISDVIVQNLDTDNVFVDTKQDSVSGEGIKLFGTGVVTSGASYSDHWNDGDIWLVSDAAASDVRVLVRYRPRPKW